MKLIVVIPQGREISFTKIAMMKITHLPNFDNYIIRNKNFTFLAESNFLCNFKNGKKISLKNYRENKKISFFFKTRDEAEKNYSRLILFKCNSAFQVIKSLEKSFCFRRNPSDNVSHRVGMVYNLPKSIFHFAVSANVKIVIEENYPLRISIYFNINSYITEDFRYYIYPTLNYDKSLDDVRKNLLEIFRKDEKIILSFFESRRKTLSKFIFGIIRKL